MTQGHVEEVVGGRIHEHSGRTKGDAKKSRRVRHGTEAALVPNRFASASR